MENQPVFVIWNEIKSYHAVGAIMRTKTVLFVVALFLMQGYAMNMNVQDDVLNIEADASATSGRSINVMPAISDTMQQYMLDNQDQNGDDDNDGDGIADDVDKDDDNDCIPDIWDADRKDFDSDGINDADDLDDDGDGFNDSEEVTDTDNLTNIYDSDNDGYHDCSSMGMLQMNMLDVLVNVLADGSVTFSIDALELVTGENAEVFWNLVDTDDFLQLNNSTTTFVVSTTGSWGDSGTWYGLADGPYCLNVELSGSDASGNSDVLDSAQECFTIDSTSNGGGNNGNSTADCEGGSDPYPTGSEWIEVNPHPAYGQNIASGDELRAIVSIGNLSNAGDCNATYEIRTLIDRTVATGGGAAGGAMFLAYPSDLQMTMQSPPPGYTAVCVGSTTCSFEISAFPSDACYSIYIGIYVYPSNTNTALGQRLDHANDYNDLWVVGGVDCTTGEYEEEEEETNLTGECSFPTFSGTPTELMAGDDLTFTWSMDGDVSDQVYLALMSGWGAQYYFSSIEDNDGSHTITLPTYMNPNADYTIYIESAYDDNRTTLCWKYGSIDILNEGEEPVDNETGPTQTVDETPRISMWYGKVNQHNENGTWMTDPDGVAGAGLYADWGENGWGDRKLEYCQRFWPSTVDVVLRDLPEEIVFYTQGNLDGYLSTKPVWECILEEDQEPVLTGSCTIDLTVTPQEIEIGETLTMEWTMTGDIPSEVRVAVASHDSGMWNVGVQYHVSQHIANTGIFEYVIPDGMNPDRDYVVYVDAALTDDFSTYCWKYGSFDLLADNEGAIDQVIENLFNTTDTTPRISMWYGKVNQHNENGTWMTDPDGTAGAGNYAQFGDDGWGDRKLEYCQRFWPNTLAVEPMGAEEIVFYTAGNTQAYLSVKPVWQCVHDTDGDGELDTVDVDDDNDGWTDILEQACGTNQLDPSDVPTDTDGDQICDLLEEAAVEAVEDGEGLPSVGLFGTLAVLGVALVFAKGRSEEL
jgi:hypothetical protein